MKFFYTLLFNLIFISSVHSEEVNYQLSGFLTTTTFSDKNWFDDSANLALNLDINYSDWAIRGQVATAYENTLRRLVLEKSTAIVPGHELAIQIGRTPRLTSFYNTINDAPGTTGMAMLPLGGFSHRMVENSTFNSIDGIKAVYTIKTEKGLIIINGDYGKLPLENQCGVQAEAAFTKCRPGYKFEPVTGAYDIGITYETNHWTTHLYHGSTRLKTTLLDPKDFVSKYLTTNYSLIHFDVTMLGARYTKDKWLFQGDYLWSRYNTAKINKELVTVGELSSFYLLGEYKWTDQFSTYATFSRSLNNGVRTNIDRSIGSTYVNNNTTISLDYHAGEGYGWQNFFSTKPGWNSWVLSVTQRF